MKRIGHKLKSLKKRLTPAQKKRRTIKIKKRDKKYSANID